MKTLVVSWDTYTWAHKLAGIISRNPKEHEVIIVMKDDQTPMHWTNQLCRKAVYAQRTDDIFWVGRALKIPKLSNMLIDPEELNESKLIAAFQMKIAFGGIQQVYFQDNTYLQTVFTAIRKKIDIDLATFDRYSGFAEVYSLTEEEQKMKHELLKLMHALPHYILEYDTEEYLYRIYDK